MDPAATLLAAADAAFARGDLAAAEAGYRSAIARFGARGEWLANLGAILIRGQRTADALPALEAAAAALPDNAAVLAMQGYARLESGHRADAISALLRALARDPQRLDAWNNLGRARAAGGDFAAAAAAWERALAISPRYTPALSNWCDALIARGDADAARDLAGRFAAAAPDDAGAWFKYGYALMLGTDLDAARAALDRVASIDPRFPLVHHDLGTIALWQNRIDDADRHFRAELDRDPHHADARFGLASALLKRRRCDEGWRELEARVDTGHGRTTGLPPTVPAWDGSPLAGTLLVLAEEGLGDVLQFARFVADAHERVSRVVLYCDGYWAPLSRLLATALGVDAVVDRSSGSLAIAAHARIMSLPRILGQGTRAVLPRGAYLTPPAADVARWAGRLRAHPDFRVGLCWGGNPRVELPHAARIDERRSIGLVHLAPLAEIPGVQFVSLQKGGSPDRELASALRLVDWSDEFTDYADTAALMANLDLVLTVDTSIVHCAGAIGRPVWMLDRFDNCWRWGTDATNPGWYETLRVFRQPAIGEWTPVVDAAAHALAPLAQAYLAARIAGG
ncbi:MAG: tetratricopeptide repeat protein [Betaproteobacteria bacterium]